VFNAEKGTIALQEIVDRILLKSGLAKYVSCTNIGASFMCSCSRMCREKSH
jgi:hypothetical protein